MKQKLTIGALLLVILFCFGIAYQNLGPVQDDGYVSPRERALLKAFDKDKDGKLSREERKEAEKANAKRRLDSMKKWDKDGDGKISREEKAAASKLDGKKKKIIHNVLAPAGDAPSKEKPSGR